MSRVIISDASCLIALDNIEHLELLHKVFRIVYTTEEVSLEFGKTLPEYIRILPVENLEIKNELEKRLDAGEASTIALALEQEGSVLIIDEKKGRKIAKEYKLQIIGTFKVLLLAKEKGILESVKPLLLSLRNAGFRFSASLIQAVLEEAEE
ncbi:MAG: DUF3368 domain-containing protein [Bacteroidota bacterium]